MALYSLIVAPGEATPEQFAAERGALRRRGWSVEELPPGTRSRLWIVERDFDSEGDAWYAIAEISEVFQRSWAPSTADKIVSVGGLTTTGRRRPLNYLPDMSMNIVNSDTALSVAAAAGGLQGAADMHSGSQPLRGAPQTDGSSSTAGSAGAVGGSAGATTTATTGQPQPSKSPTSPLSTGDRAQLYATGLEALSVKDLWEHAEKGGKLAEGMLAHLYAHRAEYAGRLPWLIAPELELLDRMSAPDRDRLTTQLFRVLTGVSSQQEALDRAAVGLAITHNQREGQRVEIGRRVVRIFDRIDTQLELRTQVARHATKFLVATTVFAFLVIAAIGAGVAVGKLDGLSAALLVFVIALFSISPAVLLLNEQPLKGLDEWRPGGSGGDDGSTGKKAAEDDSASGAKAKGDAKR